MGRPRKYTNEQILAALKQTRGMVYLASDLLGCDAGTIYHRAEQVPAVHELIHQERGKVVDTAEQKLYDAVMASEPWAIQMALKCLGKHRGYVERSELAGSFTMEVVERVIR